MSLPRGKRRISDRTRFTAEVKNEEERCYFIRHNTPRVKVLSEKSRKEFTLCYSQETLPCFVQWCSSASGDYALGLEPATTHLDGAFRMRKLGAGQTVDFEITMQITEK